MTDVCVYVCVYVFSQETYGAYSLPLLVCNANTIIHGGCVEGLCRRVCSRKASRPTVPQRSPSGDDLPGGCAKGFGPSKGFEPDGLPDGRAEGACAEGVLPARGGTRRSPRRSPSLYIISYVQCLGLKWLIF